MNKVILHKFPDEKPDENRPCFVTMQYKEDDGRVLEQPYKYNKNGNCWINLNTYVSFTSNGIVAWTYADNILPDPYIPEDKNEDGFISINLPQESGWYICKNRNGEKVICYFDNSSIEDKWVTIESSGKWTAYPIDAMTEYLPIRV